MRARRTDLKHSEVLKAIRGVLGWECMSLHAQGHGVEDILVAVPAPDDPTWFGFWLLLEVKVPEERVDKSIIYFRYTPAQIRWRELTKGWPRITAVSAEDAIAQLRERGFA